jgi:hypothetical protein
VVSTWLQCDHPGCLKWRIVPDLPGIVPEADEPWYCELNRDPARNTCEAAQQPDDAMLDEAVLALLAEAEPDQDVDELGGLPPPPSPPPPPPPPSHPRRPPPTRPLPPPTPRRLLRARKPPTRLPRLPKPRHRGGAVAAEPRPRGLLQPPPRHPSRRPRRARRARRVRRTRGTRRGRPLRSPSRPSPSPRRSRPCR